MKRRWRAIALVALASGLGCAPAAQRNARAPDVSRVAAARAVLPPDLDVVVWLDLVRLRGLWTAQPERQIAKVLAEYGVLTVADDAEARFWLKLVAQSDRFWIGCRPSRDGCLDAVFYAQGQFARLDSIDELKTLTSSIDLGAGWLRFDRRTRATRRSIGRVYAAPPDRVVVVASAELDAVERTLEQGRVDSSLQVEERGLASVVMRAPSLARHLERRAPAAARLLRRASTVRLVLDTRPSALELNVTFAFVAPEDAERAKLVLQILAPQLGFPQPESPNSAPSIELVGNELVLRLQLRAPPAEVTVEPTKKETPPDREPVNE